MLEQQAEYRDRLLQALHRVMSDFNRETFTHACDTLFEKTGEVPYLKQGVLAETLQHLYFGLLFIHPEDAAYLGKENLDLCFSLALAMMGSWRKKLGNGFSLFHDQSSNMSNQRDQWDAIVSPDVRLLTDLHQERSDSKPFWS